MGNSFLDNLKLPFNALANMAVEAADHPGEFLAESFTPYGNYVSARDAREDFAAGDYGWGAFNALAALPGLGIVGKAGRGARRGATKKELDVARKNAADMLDLPKNNTRADRARALGRVDDPLWRGGRPANEAGEMGNQSWFSRDKKTAQGHATKPGNELGRYVMLKNAESFPANQPWALRTDDAAGIATALRNDGYTDLAAHFEAIASGDYETTVALAAKALETAAGEPGMRKYLGAVGFDAADFGQDVAVTSWNKGVMRDPKRAAFDPARLGDPSVYAGFAGAGALNAFMNPETEDGLY